MTAAGVEHTSQITGTAGGGSPTTAGSRRPRWHRRRDVWAVIGAVGFAVVAVIMFGRRYTYFDMRIYHGAVEWWLGGGELYDFIAPNTTLGFTYPPFAALVMLPMASMSAVSAGWVNTLGSVAALAAVLAMLLLPIADRYHWPRWPTLGVALPLALALEPARETVGFGQVNLLLFALIMADLLALRWRAAGGARLAVATARATSLTTTLVRWGLLGRDRRGARPADQPVASPRWLSTLTRWWFTGAWAGAGIGLATAVKVTPGLFIIYLLVSRQWRTATVATVTAAGASLATWLVTPHEATSYFTHVLWQTDRVGAADFTPNQSLAGVLARLHDVPEAPTLLWLSFAALCCALGLSRAVSAHREGDELTAFTLIGLTAAVISPISWTHHLVFVLPAVLVLLDAALRRRAAGRRTGLSWRSLGRSARSGFRPGVGGLRPGAGGLAGLRSSASGLAGLLPGGGGLGLAGLRSGGGLAVRYGGGGLAGLRYGAAALGVYALFLVSPIWWVRHRLPEGSHYDSGMWGLLAENSLALGVILLVALLPWRTGADFPPTRSWT